MRARVCVCVCVCVRVCVCAEELCASIVRSHRETSQYRVEELQALRWKIFTRDEIQIFHTKVPHTTATGSQERHSTHP